MFHRQAPSLLADSLELELPPAEDIVDEDTFVSWLADAVDYWMQYRMEQLMSLCYTLDVDEAAVAEAFDPSAPEAANMGLARLLYRRQVQRLETKEKFKPQPLEDEDAW